MPDAPFTSHPHDQIPLGRNVVPIPECSVNPVLQNGKVIEAVDVKILSCASVWLRCQREAEKWISDCDGKPLTNALLVNSRINAAYAYLWLHDNRFQWAGLAAFASKQVGCGLLHAAATVAKNRREVERVQKSFAAAAAPGVGFATMGNAAVAKGSDHMEDQLALGNKTLFLDIYPLHRFYMLRGIKGMRTCLEERQQIRGKVLWPDAVKNVLPFGKRFPEILRGFEEIERGNLAESVRQLARHEQLNVLQTIIYNNAGTRVALDGNQFAWVTGLPTGDYTEVQLTLSAQCAPKKGWTTWLSRSLNVQLYNETDRMEFVDRAAADFDRLLRKQRPQLERSLKEIFMGKGTK
ncbi:MAG: hypothetical protein ABWY02_11850 [Telluria sp.]